MKIPVRLQDIKNNPEMLAQTSTFLAQEMAILNCTEVESLTEEQLTILFSNIPQDWNFDRLGHVFDSDTFTDSFAEQLTEWFQNRSDRPQPDKSQSDLGSGSEHSSARTTTIESGSTRSQLNTFNPNSDSEIVKQANELDIFNLRDEVISDYRNYIESFLKIRDENVKNFVKKQLDEGYFWRDPLVQLNPAYKRSAEIESLIKEKILHPNCQAYFDNFKFYQHQEQAFRCARKEDPYVLTTGTGSGKSLSYVVPIIDDLLRHPEIKGVRAILVYPMNALINSQAEEFKKFIDTNSHIKVAKYTGQESLQRKTQIQDNPPQILLTNYVMLELMLTRVHEDKLVRSKDLKFLVLDELHTYRGRQGADVAIVIRKLRQRCGNKLLCIGTSATMSTEGDRSHRRQTVASVASKLFGVEIKPENVIHETL